MTPAVITIDGVVSAMRFGEVHELLEAAKGSDSRALVLDLSNAVEIDPMVAAEIVLFLRRRLRHGFPTAVVPPKVHGDWVTHAGSLAEMHFFGDREAAIASVMPRRS